MVKPRFVRCEQLARCDTAEIVGLSIVLYSMFSSVLDSIQKVWLTNIPFGNPLLSIGQADNQNETYPHTF
ncbi:hypothetical protein CA54_57710 [Symmachiella macrocystis]|uniref:Uncharacterized protein n=1 Tax=Symmachiella macrocystis TaxID=2527985 RepID=A0A5C6B4Y7_9PLAN|nr:hypothetical protein CA54_57710 [Symmachiella macrocystis]